MQSQSTDVNAITSILASWRASVNAGDADGLLALVAEDLEMIPPGEKAIRGADRSEYRQNPSRS